METIQEALDETIDWDVLEGTDNQPERVGSMTFVSVYQLQDAFNPFSSIYPFLNLIIIYKYLAHREYYKRYENMGYTS